MKNNPLISIVTIVYNNVATIEKTILSVLNQTYENIEYIIIDGGSTDGTVDIIKKYDKQISHWISEPDKGIYDAMNKGIEEATGKWIGFINSGDRYHTDTVIDDIFKNEHNEDVLYGDTLMHYQLVDMILAPHDLKEIKKHMVFSHPSSFTRTQLAKKYKYDIKYQIAADDNFFYQLFELGYTFKYLPICISFFDRTDRGISKANSKLARGESDIIRGKTINLLWNIKYYINLYKVNIRSALVFLVPPKILNKRRQRKMHQNKRIKQWNSFNFD
jgi:glycosyltransferase involved in cell wall biosynthesis